MNNDHEALRVPVLVVGGGPAGLMTSLLLARHGVGSLLVERRPGPSPLPRATGINVRSMEILRVVGLEAAIRSVEVDVRGLPVITDMETFDGPVLKATPNANSRSVDDPDWPSPTAQGFCSQDVLEPLLVTALRESPHPDVRFHTELAHFEQDAQGVSAVLRDLAGGPGLAVRAQYLVAADGAHSSIRDALGIGMTGHDHISGEINVLFEADLSRALAGRRSIVFRLRNRWLPHGAILRSNDGRNRWSLIGRDPGDASPSRLVEIVRGCAGDPRLPVKIVAVGKWIKAALLADRFRAGRVFLVGDAAHRLAPAGAMGMNTAIQGVHNLAWKLAAALKHQAGAELLDTYETERRPLSERSVGLSYQNELAGDHARPVLGLILGAAYDAGALVPDGTPPPDTPDPTTVYVPTARPGHRAPHHWVHVGGRRQSTIDLFDGRFVLLSPAEAWPAAARGVAAARGIPLASHVIRDDAWAAAYSLHQGGAVLVRPDGYVAWRRQGASDHMTGELAQALDAVLGRPQGYRWGGQHPSRRRSSTTWPA